MDGAFNSNYRRLLDVWIHEWIIKEEEEEEEEWTSGMEICEEAGMQMILV